MFVELGIKLDNLIEDVLQWNRRKPLYKFYVYIFIKNNFDEYTDKLIKLAYDCKYLYKWQYRKLLKLKGEIKWL